MNFLSDQLKEAALRYYEGDYNCSQCILKAAEDVYGLQIPEDCYEMCKCFSNGLGVGSTCNAIEVGLFIFGLMFDHTTCLRLRVKLMTLFHNRYRTIYCHHIKKKLKADEPDCRRTIGETAALIGKIIDDEKRIHT